MYENLSTRKIKNCILAIRCALDPKAVTKCKTSDCGNCGWNRYENKRRQIDLVKRSSAKHWVKRKDTL